MSALEKLLIEEKIKGLNQKTLDYQTALNHARDSDFSLSKKSSNVCFQSSPRQLVAHILKKQHEKCFHTNEITLQAFKIDNA